MTEEALRTEIESHNATTALFYHQRDRADTLERDLGAWKRIASSNHEQAVRVGMLLDIADREVEYHSTRAERFKKALREIAARENPWGEVQADLPSVMQVARSALFAEDST